ncbi:hypothetical protein XENOCAPTIV_015291, partial [Xenoophorus captivus]
VSISACVEDCGPYGECRLLRSYTYLYAACVCTAGWKGWGCTDGSTAQSYSRQLTATMLLTLSNLFFLPAIVVAIRRSYITEASVYLFTMFFSTTLFLLGALLIAMSMQLDRKGLWNLLAPILCAILLMVISWVRDILALMLFAS